MQVSQLIEYDFDVQRLRDDIELLRQRGYLTAHDHQICLTGMDANSSWRDGVGKLLERYPQYERSMDVEVQFNTWLPEFDDLYAKEVYQQLSQRWRLGRMRVMEIMPKACYSWHKDVSPRLHVAIDTDHTKCGLIVEDGICRVPADGNAYLIDTTRYHTAFNAMDRSRLHLVAVVVDER